MNLIKTSSLSGLAQIIRLFTGLLVTKLIAVLVGPSGVAIIGQLQNILSLSTLASGDFLKTTLLRYTAKENATSSKDFATLWSASFKIALSASVTVSILLYFFSKELSEYLLKDESYHIILKILAFSLPLFVANSLFLAILNGLKRIKLYILISILINIVSATLVGCLAYFFGLKGALIAYVTNQSIILFLTLFLIRNQKWFKFENFTKKLGFSKSPIYKELLLFSSITFTSVAASSLSMLYARSFLIEHLSIETTGIWQGLWSLTSLGIGFITASLSTYLIPTLSGISEKKLLNKELKKTIKIVIPITITGLILAFILRDFIILTLYSDEFIEMSSLFAWQLIGALFKVSGWLFGIVFVSKGLVKISVTLEVLFACTWCLLLTVLVQFFDSVDGAVYAFALNSFLYLVVVTYIYRYKL